MMRVLFEDELYNITRTKNEHKNREEEEETM